MSLSFLSHLHDDLSSRGGKGATPPRKEKLYPRMPQISLPEPAPLSEPIGETFKKRSSAHEFTGDAHLSIKNVSTLLSGLREREDGTRPYPSGGARFPIETYVIAKKVETLAGIYHYAPKKHYLEHLWKLPGESKIFYDFPSANWAENASLVIIFTALWERSDVKYGDSTYILALLEAGHMAQNILLAATALGIGSCPLVGVDRKRVEQLLELDTEYEQVIYSIALG